MDVDKILKMLEAEDKPFAKPRREVVAKESLIAATGGDYTSINNLLEEDLAIDERRTQQALRPMKFVKPAEENIGAVVDVDNPIPSPVKKANETVSNDALSKAKAAIREYLDDSRGGYPFADLILLENALPSDIPSEVLEDLVESGWLVPVSEENPKVRSYMEETNMDTLENIEPMYKIKETSGFAKENTANSPPMAVWVKEKDEWKLWGGAHQKVKDYFESEEFLKEASAKNKTTYTDSKVLPNDGSSPAKESSDQAAQFKTSQNNGFETDQSKEVGSFGADKNVEKIDFKSKNHRHETSESPEVGKAVVMTEKETEKAVGEAVVETRSDSAFPEEIDFDEEAFAELFDLDPETIDVAYIPAKENEAERLEVSFTADEDIYVIKILDTGSVEETVNAEIVDEPRFSAEIVQDDDGKFQLLISAANEKTDEDGNEGSTEFVDGEAGLDLDEFFTNKDDETNLLVATENTKNISDEEFFGMSKEDPIKILNETKELSEDNFYSEVSSDAEYLWTVANGDVGSRIVGTIIRSLNDKYKDLDNDQINIKVNAEAPSIIKSTWDRYKKELQKEIDLIITQANTKMDEILSKI